MLPISRLIPALLLPLLATRAVADSFQKAQGFGEVRALTGEMLYTATRKLVKDFDLQDANGQPLRVNVRRLRKTFTNRIYEILGDDLVAAARAGRATPRRSSEITTGLWT